MCVPAPPRDKQYCVSVERVPVGEQAEAARLSTHAMLFCRSSRARLMLSACYSAPVSFQQFICIINGKYLFI